MVWDKIGMGIYTRYSCYQLYDSTAAATSPARLSPTLWLIHIHLDAACRRHRCRRSETTLPPASPEPDGRGYEGKRGQRIRQRVDVTRGSGRYTLLFFVAVIVL